MDEVSVELSARVRQGGRVGGVPSYACRTRLDRCRVGRPNNLDHYDQGPSAARDRLPPVEILTSYLILDEYDCLYIICLDAITSVPSCTVLTPMYRHFLHENDAVCYHLPTKHSFCKVSA